jgi:uncharacterized protein YdaU (DUF1376 family)
MNYYEFHIGDWAGATRHLTCLERGLYRDMIDMYYDTEQPLPLDLKTLKRKLMARSTEESDAVDSVLAEFFTETKGGYFNKRCDETIHRYHENQSAKSVAGKASAAKREQARIERLAALNGTSAPVELCSQSVQQNSTPVEHLLDSVPTDTQRNPTNQKPITNNQEPVTSNQIKSQKAFVENLEKMTFSDLQIDALPQPWVDLIRSDWPDLHPDDLQAKWDKYRSNAAKHSTLMLTADEFYQDFKIRWIDQDAPRLIEMRSAKAQAPAPKPPATVMPTPAPIGLAGIELVIFRDLRKHDKTLTELTVFDIAADRGWTVLQVLQDMRDATAGVAS